MYRAGEYIVKTPVTSGKFILHRLLATQVQSIKLDENFIQNSVNKTPENWKNSLPYEKIPGPSKLALLLSNLPGGQYYKLPLNDLLSNFRKTYGDFMKIPGLFGNKDMLLVHDPEIFKTIFRNEGVWPHRRGPQAMNYYRRHVRPDIFAEAVGLVTTQDKEWGDLRTAVNPVMMQPKTVKLYIPIIDNIVNDFIKRMRKIRDLKTLELPENFEDELNNWALESIGAIALDTRFGLVKADASTDSNAKTLFESIKRAFDLMYEIEFKPSTWRYIKTPKFKEFIQLLDNITDITSSYVQTAKKRIEELPKTAKSDREESVLQKLLKINQNIAHVMALDMLFAGVDTTSSAFVATLYQLAKNPDKQEILRKEIKSILTSKDTPLTVENMNQLPYLRACIKEAIRIRPVTSVNARSSIKDMVLNGYQIPKGTDILMGSYELHMQDDNFPQAKQFIPERWLKETRPEGCPSAKEAHPFIYLPFGFGPRMCIGKRFAQMEIEILTARIIRNFIVEWNYPDLKYKSTMINAPDGKLMFKINDVNV